MSTQQGRPNLCGILSETCRIILAQRRHYSALSILFILPITLSPVIHPFLLQPKSLRSAYGKSQSIFQIILYFFCLFLFGICGGASITYTTFRGFYGKPVRFISSLKSIWVSFFPLLATKLFSLMILVWIILGFGILAYNVLLLLGVDIEYDSRYFLVFAIVIAGFLAAAATYLQVGWCLATAVVVVESRSGLAALERSWYLVKGMRWVVFSIILLFGVSSVLLSKWCSSLVVNASRNGWTSWEFVVQMIVCVGFWTRLSVFSTAATTVLFIYCKALHDEETAAFRLSMTSSVGNMSTCLLNDRKIDFAQVFDL